MTDISDLDGACCIQCGCPLRHPKDVDEIARLRAALEGMLMEWDRLSRYGSPMAKAANERVAAARSALAHSSGADR